MPKIDKWTPPEIDGIAELGLTYMTFNSKWTSKEQAILAFKIKYRQDPEIVFIGKPGGTLVYAGPVPGSRLIGDNIIASQPNLI